MRVAGCSTPEIDQRSDCALDQVSRRRHGLRLAIKSQIICGNIKEMSKLRSRSPRRFEKEAEKTPLHARLHTDSWIKNVAPYLPDEDVLRFSATRKEYRSELPVSELSSYKYCRPMICTYAGECISSGGKLQGDRRALLWKKCQRTDLPTLYQEKVVYLYNFSKAFLKLLFRIYKDEAMRYPVILRFPSESVEMSLNTSTLFLDFRYEIRGEIVCRLKYPHDPSSFWGPYLQLLKDEDVEYTYEERFPTESPPPSSEAESLIDALLSNRFHTGRPETSIKGVLELRDQSDYFQIRTREVYFRYI